MTIESQLNPAQFQAVTTENNAVLVIAGAGSGKTRVLTQRIAWLIQQQHISPHAILAVTFTNKAAAEMRARIEELLQMPMRSMWIGTFHGMAHRFLRLHWQRAGLPENFQVLDSDDQYRLVRRVLKNLNLDEEQYPPKQLQWWINHQKDNGLRPDKIPQDHHPYTAVATKVYKEYQQLCVDRGLIDFAELLLLNCEVLSTDAEIRAHYQGRFQHILIDEFQDTNAIQYRWFSLLKSPQSAVMVVGDDDQSIYTWRGARVEHMQQFLKDYAPVETIRLEENYRSTATILAAANAVIACNEERMGKTLWTTGPQGEAISLYAAFNDVEEAHFILSKIQQALNSNYRPSDIAVLYRSNAQSRLIEEQLVRAGIPYRVYGGLKFFERAEIKDALAYLRLIVNLQDDAAFERIVNVPTRGIGNTTVETIRNYARENQCALWQASVAICQQQLIAPRAINHLQQFLELIKLFSVETENQTLEWTMTHVIQRSGLLAHYQEDRSEKGVAKVENLEELINAARQFVPDVNISASTLVNFLNYVALETGEMETDNATDFVHLMTLHSAKGLEFPVVFMCGMEEGLFPHQLSSNDPRKLEEERRLCYVGMTRAQHKLYLSYAEVRRMHGRENYALPSRFLQEIPAEHIEPVRIAKISRPSVAPLAPRKPLVQKLPASAPASLYRVGQQVRHSSFGEGVILNCEEQAQHTRLLIKFNKVGTKLLVANPDKLTLC